MRDFNETEREEEQEDELAFGKGQKSAVLEAEDDDDNVIHSDDANYEAADFPSIDEGEETEKDLSLYERESEDDLSLQF